MPAPAPPGSPGARPIPYPVTPPPGYERAVARGTRSAGGAPGPAYWQQWSDYSLRAKVYPRRKRLEGSARIHYENRSPATLDALYLFLTQNVHSPGAIRNEPYEVTGGVTLGRVAVDGTEIFPNPARDEPGYRIRGTVLEIVPPEPVLPGGAVEIEAEWAFRIPRSGAGGRMGWDSDDLLFLAYWYPQMAVYDDVVGWQRDPFLGSAEFYAGFGSYDLRIQVPQGWLVRATGRQENPASVLSAPVLGRLELAESSDTVVHVVTEEDLASGRVTRRSEDGWLTWSFHADTVHDASFSVTRRSLWDAARTPVGDRDGDGETDFTRVEATFRLSASHWHEAARYAQHAIRFHSRFTGLPYPWPHMTAVEGGGIIQGGMEFPMMTLIGDYNARGDSALYYVTAHELGHMWVPMTLSTDERRYGWMDEGMTTYLENQARKEFFPGNPADSLERESYLAVAGTGREGPMMRWPDYQYPGPAAAVASYSKPATLLAALRGLLGEQIFLRAYRTFMEEWAFKQPKPWDFFHTFDRVSGRDLWWFWRSWYYETWTLDQAVERVSPSADGSGTQVLIEDRGRVPMPARLLITRVDGTRLRREIPVRRWLAGARQAAVTVPAGAPVIRVEIDPEHVFPDADRENNVWVR
ncbi:MAG: M1 family metallopeptidase [Gemmatimonadota bacterium]